MDMKIRATTISLALIGFRLFLRNRVLSLECEFLTFIIKLLVYFLLNQTALIDNAYVIILPQIRPTYNNYN